MAATPESASPLSVPRWTDTLSGLQARHPRFWIGLGKLESRLLADRIAEIPIEKPIWVTGLARSGTTILLELLARHPQTATHRYRDFPPVLSPWFWNWFVDHAGNRPQAADERAHGDGIRVTAESPEAFEEVIWMAFFPKLHDPEISADMTADTANDDFEAFYRDHMRKIMALRGGQRYLAKANYNLTRIAYLLELFPDARFVVPFRDPVWHVASLMRQHELFCREHTRDLRLKRHMSREGHFEFGLDRRPVNRGDTYTTREILEHWSAGRDAEGWALYWKDIHEYVADRLEADAALRRATLLVDYDRFCSEPRAVMQSLLAHCALPPAEIDLAGEAAATVHPPAYYRPSFSDREIATIRAVTGAVSDRLQRLAGANAEPA